MLEYYNKNAENMIENTLKLDLKPIYERFERYIKPGGKILDAGFGSGRDSLHFRSKGFDVVSVDYSPEVVRRGKTLLNNEVLQVDIREIRYVSEFDAVWASAIFFHFEDDEIKNVLDLCWNALRDNGVLYMSFKYGKHLRQKDGRIFNDFDEEKIERLLNDVSGYEVLEIWKTKDARADRIDKYWTNVILQKRYC